jgi:hypothetical protein
MESDLKRKNVPSDPVPEHPQDKPGMIINIPLDCTTGDCGHNLEVKKKKYNPV